jgi:hypothetical protein
MRHILFLALCGVLTFAFPMGLAAFPACDNFGQDWNINLGPYGGSFPGTLVVSGCRDCDGSLGCGGVPPLDGAAVLTAGTGGSPYTIMWSMVAYRPGSGSCVSTHWNGSSPAGSTSVRGTVSNEFGPFGNMNIRLGDSCREASGGDDPAVGVGSRWGGEGDSRGNSFVLP